MAEASDVEDRGNRQPKRRKLNIENDDLQEAIGRTPDTPKSQGIGHPIGTKKSSIIVDLTGSDDELTTASVPGTPRSVQDSVDGRGVDTSRTSVHKFTRKVEHVQVPRHTLASVAFAGCNPPEECSELDVLVETHDLGVQYLELDDFTVYYPHSHCKRSMEMSTLDRLQVAKGADELCFSGRLSTKTSSFYVHGVGFNTLAVDGYGDDESASLLEKICIQTPWARSYNVWYRLGQPSAEYREYHQDYIWLATFTKYFIDYLIEQDSDVTLHRFRSHFATWMIRRYGQHVPFQVWHEKCGRQQDFGTAVAAYIPYLLKECYSIDDSETGLLQHSIWREIDPANLSAIKRQPVNPTGQTVVTPFAFRCFRDMYFAAHLTIRNPSPAVQAQISDRKRDMCLTPWNAAPVSRPGLSQANKAASLDVCQGDVVCVNTNSDNQWKHSKSEVWYAYVSNVHKKSGNRPTNLDVLWLYEPSDTTLGGADYPFENELFLSDNCSCGEHAIAIEAVTAKLNVAWFINDPHAVDGYFVRQKFQTCEAEDSYGFTTLTSGDFSCHDSHISDFELCQNYYEVGQTVLARESDNDDLSILLEPMRIVWFDEVKQRVVLRKFYRASRKDPVAPPNELIESDEEIVLTAECIVRSCKVGEFSTREEVCLPFDRNGLGDRFYILKDCVVSSSQTSFQTPPASDMDEEGYKSPCAPSMSPLIGLDLYCGGGNFGRGLEEAGIVKMRYAVDWDASALHSYRANTENPAKTHYYLGSVNDYLHHALRGSTKVEIAGIGSIQFASAGSPCPGFSTMQPNKQSDQSLRFASMVASVVAFVDTYSPQYFILENVVPMTFKIVVDGKEQNVFSQILASLVALGYQVQQFLGDAWTLGSSQSRSRVFIVASAPGTVPLFPPPCTHGHPPGKPIRRNLGRTTNGLPFGIRKYESTPFTYVSAEAATRDLPDISDSSTQLCPRFPDHRTHAVQNLTTRQRLTRVPIHPHGMGLSRAVQEGKVTSGEAYHWVKNCSGLRAGKGSRSYSRIKPDGLFPTVLTDLHLQCAINGNVLHWEQHRSLSIMETRRAQGFLDHEVIVGYPSQQLKIVGNSVDRKVAFAMGLVMKESWDNTLKLRREMLQDNASTTQLPLKQQSFNTDGHYINGNFSHPSPIQIEAVRRESSQKRAEALATILRKLQVNRPKERGDRRLEEPVATVSQRWSGESPADAITVRRRVIELNEVLYTDRGCSP